MDKIHPATYVLWFLLMASIATNFVQQSQIKRLAKEFQPVIIRQNIEVFTKPPKGIRYIRHGF